MFYYRKEKKMKQILCATLMSFLCLDYVCGMDTYVAQLDMESERFIDCFNTLNNVPATDEDQQGRLDLLYEDIYNSVDEIEHLIKDLPEDRLKELAFSYMSGFCDSAACVVLVKAFKASNPFCVGFCYLNHHFRMGIDQVLKLPNTDEKNLLFGGDWFRVGLLPKSENPVSALSYVIGTIMVARGQ
jgi:hypothetical protein